MPTFQHQYIHMCILEAYLLCSLSSFAEKTSEEIGLPKLNAPLQIWYLTGQDKHLFSLAKSITIGFTIVHNCFHWYSLLSNSII